MSHKSRKKVVVGEKHQIWLFTRNQRVSIGTRLRRQIPKLCAQNGYCWEMNQRPSAEVSEETRLPAPLPTGIRAVTVVPFPGLPSTVNSPSNIKACSCIPSSLRDWGAVNSFPVIPRQSSLTVRMTNRNDPAICCEELELSNLPVFCLDNSTIRRDELRDLSAIECLNSSLRHCMDCQN